MTNYITDVDVAQLYMCAHIFAGGLSQYPEFLAGVSDLQFDFVQVFVWCLAIDNECDSLTLSE